eukprot:763612-Hanusia_phi.AAC.9
MASTCKPQTCMPLDTGNTSQGTNYMSVSCLTNFPSAPAPVPGQLVRFLPLGSSSAETLLQMEYKVKTTWYNPTCAGRPVEVLYTLDNKCVWNTNTNDNTYIKVDTRQHKTYYYSFGDHKCQNSVRSESWAAELQTSSQCAASVQCGMTQTPQFFDPSSSVDMSTCMSTFSTVSVLVNAASSTGATRACSDWNLTQLTGSDHWGFIAPVLVALLQLTSTMR